MSRDYFKITKDVLRKIDCKKQLKFKANEDSLHIFCSDKGIAKAAMLGFKVIILNRETICLEDNDTITIISSTDIRLDDNEIRLFGNTHFTSVDLENVDSHEATNMKYLFYGCKKLAEIDKLHIKNYIGYEDISDILIDAGISKEVIIDNAAIQSPPPEKTTKTTIFSWDNLE